MWARQNNEWWPAEVASVSEDGMLCVSFLGWDSRHNVWMDPPKADAVDPQIVFEPPAARRRAPERLFDEVQAQGPRMAVESKPNPRSCTGPGTPGTGERPQLALKRQRTSALAGAVRVVEGAHAGGADESEVAALVESVSSLVADLEKENVFGAFIRFPRSDDSFFAHL